jgi:hypothetical protein
MTDRPHKYGTAVLLGSYTTPLYSRILRCIIYDICGASLTELNDEA